MNESTARNIRVQDRYDELMRIGRHGHYETMFQVVREEIESLRQQLASCDAEIERLKTVPMRYRRMAFNAQLQNENAQLSQELQEVCNAIGSPEYMDPPDGGSVTIAEQVSRMREDRNQLRQQVTLLRDVLKFYMDNGICEPFYHRVAEALSATKQKP